MPKITLEEMVRNLNKEKLTELILELARQNSDARRWVLEWLKDDIEKEVKQEIEPSEESEETYIKGQLLMEYWSNAKEIISDFNRFGGGPEDEETEAYDWLEKIRELIAEGMVSPEVKREFLNEAFMEYNCNNSGFEDTLVELFFTLCLTQEEWEYLIQKLEEKPSDWRNSLIMDIYKNRLGDDEGYLRMRMKKLEYGMDYWDLAGYYLKNRMKAKAVEIAEAGIASGKGRLSELFDFLFKHFAATKDESNLDRIAMTAVTRKNYAKEMLSQLFEYYKDHDYEKARALLLPSYQCSYPTAYYQEYLKIKAYLRPADWAEMEPKLCELAKKNDTKDFLRICLEKGLKEQVLQVILKPQGYGAASDYDELADQLAHSFPQQIAEHYLSKARRLIDGGNRSTYYTATGYLKKVKSIYSKYIKDKVLWQQKLDIIKSDFRKRPAFIEILNKSGL